MSRLKVYDLATASWKYVGGIDAIALATNVEFTSRFMPLGVSGTYTPTLTGMTLGSGGVNTASYKHIGNNQYIVKGVITLGTGFTIPSNAVLSLPSGLTIVDYTLYEPLGLVTLYDVGTGRWSGMVYAFTSTSIQLVAYQGGTNVTTTPILATVPITWVAGDQMIYRYTVNMA